MYHPAWGQVHSADGLLVPGGFGMRGAEGIIAAIRSARENGKPFLGICLGMQLAVVEYARHVCGMPDATSEEFDREIAQDRKRRLSSGLPLDDAALVKDSPVPKTTAADYAIVNMEDLNRENMGGTMRLGLQETHFQPGSDWSKMRSMYQRKTWAPATAKAPANISGPSLTNGTTKLANGVTKSPSSTTPASTNGLINSSKNDSTSTSAPHSAQPLVNSTTDQVATSSGAPSPFIIAERHRHAYEVNPALIDKFTSTPCPSAKTASSTTSAQPNYELHFVGKDASGLRMEILELKNHPWFVGVQFHPEYLSRVLKPSKPYLGFVAASAGVLGDLGA